MSGNDGTDTGVAGEFMKSTVRDKGQFGGSMESTSRVMPRHSGNRSSYILGKCTCGARVLLCSYFDTVF